jgi:hypothetical protein
VKIDWYEHTPEEIWAALRSAPKIAGPWEGVYAGGPLDCRRTPDGNWAVHRNADGYTVDALGFWTPKNQTYVDDRLRNSGWILIGDEPKTVERPVAWKRLDRIPG